MHSSARTNPVPVLRARYAVPLKDFSATALNAHVITAGAVDAKALEKERQELGTEVAAALGEGTSSTEYIADMVELMRKDSFSVLVEAASASKLGGRGMPGRLDQAEGKRRRDETRQRQSNLLATALKDKRILPIIWRRFCFVCVRSAMALCAPSERGFVKFMRYPIASPRNPEHEHLLWRPKQANESEAQARAKRVAVGFDLRIPRVDVAAAKEGGGEGGGAEGAGAGAGGEVGAVAAAGGGGAVGAGAGGGAAGAATGGGGGGAVAAATAVAAAAAAAVGSIDSIGSSSSSSSSGGKKQQQQQQQQQKKQQKKTVLNPGTLTDLGFNGFKLIADPSLGTTISTRNPFPPNYDDEYGTMVQPLNIIARKPRPAQLHGYPPAPMLAIRDGKEEGDYRSYIPTPTPGLSEPAYPIPRSSSFAADIEAYNMHERYGNPSHAGTEGEFFTFLVKHNPGSRSLEEAIFFPTEAQVTRHKQNCKETKAAYEARAKALGKRVARGKGDEMKTGEEIQALQAVPGANAGPLLQHQRREEATAARQASEKAERNAKKARQQQEKKRKREVNQRVAAEAKAEAEESKLKRKEAREERAKEKEELKAMRAEKKREQAETKTREEEEKQRRRDERERKRDEKAAAKAAAKEAAKEAKAAAKAAAKEAAKEAKAVAKAAKAAAKATKAAAKAAAKEAKAVAKAAAKATKAAAAAATTGKRKRGGGGGGSKGGGGEGGARKKRRS